MFNDREQVRRAIETAPVIELLEMWDNYVAREIPDEATSLDEWGELEVPLSVALRRIDIDALIDYYTAPPADAWLPDCLSTFCGHLYTVYAERDDMTFIMKETETTIECVGWYFGDDDDPETVLKHTGSMTAEKDQGEVEYAILYSYGDYGDGVGAPDLETAIERARYLRENGYPDAYIEETRYTDAGGHEVTREIRDF